MINFVNHWPLFIMKKLFRLNDHWDSLKRFNFSDEFHRLKRNRDAFVFLIFLFVSTTFWFLNALRDNYLATFSFPVKFVNVPDNEVIAGSVTKSINLRVKGSGYSILRQYISNTLSTPTYDVSKLRRIEHEGSEQAILISRDQRKHFQGQLFLEMDLIDILPDTIFIELQKLESKKVPIRFNGKLNLEKQFLMAGPVLFEPDSVEVSGPKNIVDTLSAILTRHFVYEKVRDTLVRNVGLLNPEGLEISLKSSSMLIPVEPFSESSIVIPIDVIGLADSLRGKTFPSEVNITFRTGLSKFDKISPNDFRAIVDASTAFTEGGTTRLRVKIDKTPVGIYSMDYSPIFVEYLIERKR